MAWAGLVLILVAAGGSWAAEADKPQSSPPASVTQAAADRASRPEVVAVYYPHWHNYDHGSSWKGEGWTEWEGVKAATARFPGHHQPLKPSWGYFDESDPNWTAREIDLAADHGIDVFLFDWYWYSGVKTMEEALERGFLQAKNRQRMKFALMWANHDRRDQFCPEFGKERTVWLPSRHSPGDLRRVVDYGIQHYFRQPNYWRPQGELFFSVFEAVRFVKELGGPEKTRAVLAEMDARLREAGLPPMHWNAMVSDSKAGEMLRAAGFKSTSRYNVTDAKVQPDGTKRYEEVIESHQKHWNDMLSSPLVDLPVVTHGWDSTPRCRADVAWPFPYAPKSAKRPYYEYPYTPVVVGNTPEQFERLLRDAARHVERSPRHPFAIVINAWNEWTEGCYLLPEERYGTQYVEAIRRVFGQKARPAVSP
jgi:hypothetical protein